MTEQQFHLKNLLNQRDSIGKEINSFQEKIAQRKEVFFKVQGAIDYLTQIGVEILENEDSSELENSETEETVSEES